MTEPQQATAGTIQLFTDGACSGNPGCGGWAYILRHGPSGKEQTRWNVEQDTTNNRMELMGVIAGLEALTHGCEVDLYTDSEYVGKGIRDWMPSWKRRGWKRAGGKTIKNLDLWQRLDQQVQRHRIHYCPVRGHSGHPENELCDELAVAAYLGTAPAATRAKD